MKKFFVGGIISVALFVIGCSLSSANSDAKVIFSTPVITGFSVCFLQGGGGMGVRGATENTGDFYRREYNGKTIIYDGSGEKSHARYGKGVARYGDGEAALYAHYDAYNIGNDANIHFGAQDIQNTVPINSFVFGEEIFKIETNTGKIFYMIHTSYDLPDETWWTLIGRNKDGIWTKYFESDAVTEKYFGQSARGGQANVWNGSSICCDNFRLKDDIMVVEYSRFHKELGQRGELVKEGEFRFKWNDMAQKFDVENIEYSKLSDEEKAIVILERGENFYKFGKDREALECYNQAVALNSQLADAYISRSVVLYIASRTWGERTFQAKAREDINRALEINPNSARAYRWRGVMNFYGDSNDAALADINKAIQLDPSYLDAYESRANIYMKLKEFDKAIADYTHVIDSPNFKTAYMQHYDFDLMSDWPWYSDYDQRLAALYSGRGNACYEKGDKSNAIADYKRALKLSPNNMWIGRPLRRDDPHALE